MSSERLPLVNRTRVLTRRVLLRALRVVPPGAVDVVHSRWVDATGARRRAMQPLARVLFYRSLSVRTFTVPDGQGERLGVAGSRMERELYWFGEDGYEPAEARWWRVLCAQCDDVLEIGANIGYYSVVGARVARGRYTAVEANPEAVAIVRSNLDLNELAHVDVIDRAVVGDPSVHEIELAFPDQEAHSVAPTGSWVPTASEGREWVHTSSHVRVPTTPAGPLLRGRDLVKIDIEGAEAEVLDAAHDEIAAARPILLVEVLAESERLQALLGRMLDRDYLAFEMGPTLRGLDRSDLDRSGVDPTDLMDSAVIPRDVLMVPVERAAVLDGPPVS